MVFVEQRSLLIRLQESNKNTNSDTEHHCVEYEGLTAVVMNCSIFSNTTEHFRVNILPPSSGYNNKTSNNLAGSRAYGVEWSATRLEHPGRELPPPPDAEYIASVSPQSVWRV
jgi:hypothetical protein